MEEVLSFRLLWFPYKGPCQGAHFNLGIGFKRLEIANVHDSKRRLKIESVYTKLHAELPYKRKCAPKSFHLGRDITWPLFKRSSTTFLLMLRYLKTGSASPGPCGTSRTRVTTTIILQAIVRYRKENPSVGAQEVRQRLIADRICSDHNIPSWINR